MDKINRLEANKGGRGGGGGKRYPTNGKDQTRSTRRWENDNYCWSCGFDIKHTSATCKYIKDVTNHKAEATAMNPMGGSTRNLHLRNN